MTARRFLRGRGTPDWQVVKRMNLAELREVLGEERWNALGLPMTMGLKVKSNDKTKDDPKNKREDERTDEPEGNRGWLP
jgi:hypothetical protein